MPVIHRPYHVFVRQFLQFVIRTFDLDLLSLLEGEKSFRENGILAESSLRGLSNKEEEYENL